MLLGCYGDVHLTKNMRTFQDVWDTTAKKSIYNMYDKFDEFAVDSVICLGDFFDAPRIEAKYMSLLIPILDHINGRNYPTYILLGNHEIDSDESNILDFLSTYENIIPITELNEIEGMVFIPYNVDPAGVDMKDKIVFTHHDIYGSELAGGRTKAFFGVDTSIFKEAKLVMNGHVHLRSRVSKNIINAGSILVSQQGELKVGDYPQYYLIDKSTAEITPYDNKDSMIYLTTNIDDINNVVKVDYDNSHLVLKVEYSGELPENMINALHTSYRKLIDNINTTSEEIVHSSNFDMKNYLIEYIKKDTEVSDADKDSYIATGLELIDR